MAAILAGRISASTALRLVASAVSSSTRNASTVVAAAATTAAAPAAAIEASLSSASSTILNRTPLALCLIQIRNFRAKSNASPSAEPPAKPSPSSTTTSRPPSSPSPPKPTNSSSTADSSRSSNTSSSKSSSADGDNLKASEGMDLFSRALAAQRARQEQASKAAAGAGAAGSAGAAASTGSATGSGATNASASASSASSTSENIFRGPAEEEQPLSPEEEERLRRLRDRADAEEDKVVAKRGRLLLGISGVALLLAYTYMGLPGKDQKIGGLGDHHKRVMAGLTGGYKVHISASLARSVGLTNFHSIVKEITAPVGTKLLPDPLPPGYQPRNTLFIELNDTLVHMTWDKSLGWRAALRPGAKKFLAYLSRHYEIVVFTNSHNYLAAPVLEAIDPFSYYKRYALYRDSTRLINGKNVKDLSITNRDLENSIIVDTDPSSYQLQPENGIPIKPWKLEKYDDELARMTVFLEEMALMREARNVPDIRKLVAEARKFNEKDLVDGWQQYKAKLKEVYNIKSGKNNEDPAFSEGIPVASKSSTSGKTFASLVSAAANNAAGALFGRGLKSVVSNPHGPVDPLDVVGVIEYYAKLDKEMFEKEYQQKMAEIEELKKLQEEDIARQMQELKDKKLTLKDYIASGGVPPGQAPPPHGAPGSV
ncbi:mitochondrial inner membrane protein required for protein import [Phlyctochytrium planicorne]|nr:mitochondrial inner membrane protein required for protein import [Phlyctochytrium planicorne]